MTRQRRRPGFPVRNCACPSLSLSGPYLFCRTGAEARLALTLPKLGGAYRIPLVGDASLTTLSLKSRARLPPACRPGYRCTLQGIAAIRISAARSWVATCLPILEVGVTNHLGR